MSSATAISKPASGAMKGRIASPTPPRLRGPTRPKTALTAKATASPAPNCCASRSWPAKPMTAPTICGATITSAAQVNPASRLHAVKITRVMKPVRTFEEMFEHALAFLSNPLKLWLSDRIEHKRTALKLIFSERLAYDPESGFRTPKISMPFKLLADYSGDKSRMARPGGFEPLAYRFVVCRSIQTELRAHAT